MCTLEIHRLAIVVQIINSIFQFMMMFRVKIIQMIISLFFCFQSGGLFMLRQRVYACMYRYIP